MNNRQLCLKRDNFTCQHCGSNDSLQIHHKNGGGDTLDNLITLCSPCHHHEHKRLRDIEKATQCRLQLDQYYLCREAQLLKLHQIFLNRLLKTHELVQFITAKGYWIVKDLTSKYTYYHSKAKIPYKHIPIVGKPLNSNPSASGEVVE